MAKNAIPSKFLISADLKLTVTVEVHAASLADALAEADKLKITDFVKVKGELFDNEAPKVTGVSAYL